MAAATCIQILKDSLVEEARSKCAITDLIPFITSRNLSLLQLVEALQQDLLHEQASHRCKTVRALASILEELSPEFKGISEKETELITEFFCSKLKDHHSILPAALSGLQALSAVPKLPSGLAKLLIQSIFQDVHCQSQLQNDRRKVYLIIKNLLAFHLKEIQGLAQDFVFGLIQATDQERDPRNLLILFSIFPVVARYFKLEPFTEEFFEVFSCYFPIDFTPASNDPFGVTKEQLCSGLRKCLASSPHFAEYCLPLLQEKLESDLISAKVESLKTLELCCQSYQSSQLEAWIDIFWTNIRREVLINVNTDELEHASLDALTALARAFTNESGITSPAFTKLVQNVTTECQGHLCEPERRLMTPSCYILLAMCAGSAPACALIVNQVIPVLIDQYRVREQSIPRQFILNSLNKLVHAGLYGYNEQTVNQSGVDSLAETLIELYLEVFKEDDPILSNLSLQGLAHFLGIRFVYEEWDRVNQKVFSLLQQTSLQENVVEEIGRFFNKFAEQNQSCFTDRVLPQLLEMAITGNNQSSFQVLKTLPVSTEISAQIIPRLMNSLDKIDPLMKLELLKVITHFIHKEELEVLEKLHSWVLNSLNEGDPPGTLQATCAVLSRLASFLSSSNATEFIHRQTDLYTHQHLNNSGWAVLVMEATLGSLDATPMGETLDRLMNALQPLTVGHFKAEVRLSACRLVAALINKLPEGKELESLLDSLRQQWRDTHLDRSNGICLFTWITKGLLMRSYSKLNSVIEELVEFLNDSQHGHIVAEGFKTILRDTAECLNFNSHANIRIMYRQRFFQEVIPRLLKLYKESETCNKSACFAAIANQLAFVPEGVLVGHMATLIPLLVQCLAIDQPTDLIVSTINAFMGLMSDNVGAIESYVDNLVPRLLCLAQSSNSMIVRRLALQCLSELRKAQSIVILPLRSQVIRDLVPCLDDKKRLVRREAALARQKWIMLGQAGGN